MPFCLCIKYVISFMYSMYDYNTYYIKWLFSGLLAIPTIMLYFHWSFLPYFVRTLSALQSNLLCKYLEGDTKPVLLIRGNHDQYWLTCIRAETTYQYIAILSSAIWSNDTCSDYQNYILFHNNIYCNNWSSKTLIIICFCIKNERW